MEKTTLSLACFLLLLITAFAMTEAEALADVFKGHSWPCTKHKDCLDACSYRGRCPVLCVSGSCVCDCLPP
ncbi:hypothetical protein V6N12_024139 [Hibiscus sabdariffa]|uniref:Uncharacterized protein n=1 Tax=Hibiscus sabdariffa TaxID=183260 RepID=A0ABR2G058_9ROSI